MGKVLKSVQKHEKEKHTTTEEFIETMKWYIRQMTKLDHECVEAKNNLTEAFNAKLADLKAKMEEKA